MAGQTCSETRSLPNARRLTHPVTPPFLAAEQPLCSLAMLAAPDSLNMLSARFLSAAIRLQAWTLTNARYDPFPLPHFNA